MCLHGYCLYVNHITCAVDRKVNKERLTHRSEASWRCSLSWLRNRRFVLCCNSCHHTVCKEKSLMFSLVRTVLGRPQSALCSAKPVSLSCFKNHSVLSSWSPWSEILFINLLAPRPFDMKYIKKSKSDLQSNTFRLFTISHQQVALDPYQTF